MRMYRVNSKLIPNESHTYVYTRVAIVQRYYM